MVKVMFGERQRMDLLSQRQLCALKAIVGGVACDWVTKFLDILKMQKNRFFFY